MRRKTIKLWFTIFSGLIILCYYVNIRDSMAIEDYEMQIHNNITQQYFDRRKKLQMSNLGLILFKNADPAKFARDEFQNRTFVVFIWRYWDWLKNRHLYNFDSKIHDVLEDCSVKNCIFSGDDKYTDSADAIIFHMQRKQLPKIASRNTTQRWIFLSDESPINTFSLARGSHIEWSDMNNVFNWTMTYRTDSDIPVPYGRVLPLLKPMDVDMTNRKSVLTKLVPYWEKKDFSSRAIILLSNCVGNRIRFIQGLQKYIKIDVIGGCADKKENKIKCPGHFRQDCMLPVTYLFYLVLENSKCYQYITEKVFQHAYAKGAIPVIMGISARDCKDFLPPNSYLHVDNYNSFQDLAKHMVDISKDLDLFLSFHVWRKHFEIVNEHGYFKTKSYHFCRVCEALNYNDVKRKIYSEKHLQTFFSKELLCSLNYSSKKYN